MDTTVLVVDAMDGVRDALRALVAGQPGLRVAGEAAGVAEALAAGGDVVLTGLRLPDGTAADLLARDARPVVVWTFLPADERDGVDLSAAAAVIGPGELRARLGPVLRAVSARSGS